MVDPDALEVPNKLVPNVLPIIKWPDNRLHMECHPITTFDESLEQLALDLFATMKQNDGVGLAAPQVGILARICAIWIEDTTPILIVNPEIVETGNKLFQVEEGCLSVPGYFEKRKRPQRVVVKYKDVKGVEHETEFQGMYAFVVQHEIDHLNGKVFVDGSGTVKTSIIKKKMRNFLRRK